MIKVLIQNEAGSCERNKYNEKTLEYMGTSRLSHPCPYPYGFILETSAEDGDNLDCFVITRDLLKLGTIVECEPIGLMEQVEGGDEIDHKVLAVIPGQNVELNQELLEVLRTFIYNIFAQIPETSVKVGRLLPREAAIQLIQKSQNT